MAGEFDVDLNKTTPDFVAKFSNKLVWWRCSVNPDHTWEKKVYDRTKKGSPCPKCREERIGSLADRYPGLAKQFDVELNGITPDRMLANRSHREYSWRCPEGPDHVWPAALDTRIAGHGCPCCTGQQLSVTNSLASLYPEVAEQFDFEENGITPDQVIAGSGVSYSWSCPAGPDHKWEATPNDRTAKRGGTGCPCCQGLKPSVTNSLASLYPELAKEFDGEANGITPDEVVAGSNKHYSWRCSKNPDHIWPATPNARTAKRRGTGCPHCHPYDFVGGKMVSSQQKEIADLLPHSVMNFSVGGRFVDVVLADEKIGIEYDSWFWHGTKADEDRARVDEVLNLGWRVVCIKSNTQIPSRSTIDEAMERLRHGESCVEIVLPDWGEGPTYEEAFKLRGRKNGETLE